MNKLKEIRIKNNMTQKQVAEVLQIKYQQYQRYEYNINQISIKHLRNICNMFDVNSNDILDF